MSLLAAARRARFLITYHLYARAKLERTDRTKILGFALVVPPSVFHPGLSISSKILGEYLRTVPLERKLVLDMGCGSGILSLVAASCGAIVTAVDINPAAVKATVENARLNDLQERVRGLQGNLFEPLHAEGQFDYLIFNPPFYLGKPENVRDMAWRGGDEYLVIREFIARATGFMKRAARIIVILSSDMDVPKILEIFRTNGFSVECAGLKRLLFEQFYIYEALRES